MIGIMLQFDVNAATISYKNFEIKYWSTEETNNRNTYSMYPVLAFEVFDAAVQRTWSQYQDKMFRLPDAVQQIVIKFTCLQSLHVNEYCESS